MVVDSTILVDISRGSRKATDFLESVEEKVILSRVGVMELVRGAKTKRDLAKIEKLLSGLEVEVVEIGEEISKEAGSIYESFWHSHGVGVMDTFIAATALVLNEKLVTHNVKHFRFIKGLELIVPY